MGEPFHLSPTEWTLTPQIVIGGYPKVFFYTAKYFLLLFRRVVTPGETGEYLLSL